MKTESSKPVYFLIVDDLAENLVALDALLRRPGVKVLQARSGPDALELLLVYDVALAIVDVQMPGMNGFELAELMRGAEKTRRVPIIFVTAGTADRQRRFRGYEAGAVDFLTKPIEPDFLRSKADVFFELYRQREEVAQQRDELKEATERIQLLLSQSQKQAEALREADQRKDEFLATLAHELRNPLAPIRNAIEILRLRSPSSDELQAPIEIARRQVQHMARLIDDLLDIARIVKGKIELRIARCDVSQIVRNTAEDYQQTLAQARITLDITAEAEPLQVLGDPTRISQMVGNLLHNASKFTPEGGRVSVRVAREKRDAVVSVTDSGVGFDSANGMRLFEPFSQVDTAREQRGGLGLGLALTKGLVELHGGSVTGESTGVGKGASFTLRIPLSKEAHQQGESEAHDYPAVNPLSILVVEDHPDSARTLQLLLSLLGHEVRVATDGESGISEGSKLRPDVVISDLSLAGDMDGYDVARNLRSDPSTCDTLLIALSGYGRDEDRQKTREAGFDEHLTKPVDLDALKAVLARRGERSK